MRAILRAVLVIVLLLLVGFIGFWILDRWILARPGTRTPGFPLNHRRRR